MKARLPKGMGGGPKDMQGMLKEAQKMQEKMEVKQTELEEKEYTATAGGGVIEVKMLGTKELTSIKIQKEVVDPEDVEMLEDLIKAAVNQAITEIAEENEKEMEKLSGGINIPGMI